MDIRQLKYFITIAEEGNITKAAEKLYMAQPPLSRQLKLLEAELGVTLFDRKYKKNLLLTQEGRFFLTKARQIIYSLNDAVSEVQEYSQTMPKHLSIGTTVYCSEVLLPALQSFRKLYPFVTPEVHEDNIPGLLKMLDKHTIDVAISDYPLNHDNYNMVVLPADECVLVVERSFEWPKTEISIEELSLIPLILLNAPDHNSLYHQIISMFKALQLTPTISCFSYDSGLLMRMVQSDLGASILPKSMISKALDGYIRIISIKDTPWIIQPVLIWRKDSYITSTVQAFIRNFQI